MAHSQLARILSAMASYTSPGQKSPAKQKELGADIMKKTPATATVSLEDLQRRFWRMTVARRESAIQKMQSENQTDIRRKIPERQVTELQEPDQEEDPIEQFSPQRRGSRKCLSRTHESSSSTQSEHGKRGAPDTLVPPVAEE